MMSLWMDRHIQMCKFRLTVTMPVESSNHALRSPILLRLESPVPLPSLISWDQMEPHTPLVSSTSPSSLTVPLTMHFRDWRMRLGGHAISQFQKTPLSSATTKCIIQLALSVMLLALHQLSMTPLVSLTVSAGNLLAGTTSHSSFSLFSSRLYRGSAVRSKWRQGWSRKFRLMKQEMIQVDIPQTREKDSKASQWMWTLLPHIITLTWPVTVTDLKIVTEHNPNHSETSLSNILQTESIWDTTISYSSCIENQCDFCSMCLKSLSVD